MFELTKFKDKKINYNYILSIFVSLIPFSMVLGAAVMEFFIISSCLLFFYLNLNNIGKSYYKKNSFILFSFFCIFLIYGSLQSEYFLNSIRNTLFYIRFGIVTLIIWYLLENFKKFKIIFFYFITVTFIFIIFATVINLIFFEKLMYYNNRISGIFGEELVQGSFVLRTLPLFIIFYFYNKQEINRKFIYLFYIILSSSIFLILISAERSAIFLMCLMIFLMFIFLKINIKKIFIFLIAFLFLTFSTFQFFPQIKERIVDRTFKEVLDIDLRNDFNLNTDFKFNKLKFFSKGHEDHFESAIMMFRNNFISGVGVRNYRMECKKQIYKKVGKYHCTTHPHNTFAQILSETGIIGFLFFISFLIYLYLKSFSYLTDIYIKKMKINIPLATCMVLILTNFFPLIPTGSFFNNWLSMLYFFPLGLLMFELNCKKMRL